jgi:transketolase
VTRTDGPVALALTRQKLPVLAGTTGLAREGLERGGYVLADSQGEPQVILLATGSELHLAVGARAILEQGGIRARVVSMPCWERFAEQPPVYREFVLPRAVTARVSVEAGSSLGWDRWVGSEGAMLAIERFGLSAPAKDIFEHFGFTAEHVAELARGVIDGTVRGVISPPWEHLNA